MMLTLIIHGHKLNIAQSKLIFFLLKKIVLLFFLNLMLMYFFGDALYGGLVFLEGVGVLLSGGGNELF